MTRVADALKRSRSRAVAGSVPDDPAGGAIQLFTPGQPSVVSPWNVGPNAAAQPVADQRADPRQEDAHQPAAPFRSEDRPAPIALHSHTPSEKLVTSPAASAVAREQYSRLAATLYQAQLERGLKVVMVTSAAPQEGKTLTTANLALTLAEAYRRRVLLIDADLRHPTVHELFGVSNARGLADSLTVPGQLPLVHISTELSLLTAGTADDHPMSTLTSDRMRALVDEARNTFDWILLDTAPIGLLPDAKVLGSIADAALLVAAAGKTPYDDIQRAAEALGPERIFGVVLNGVTKAALPRSYGQYYRDTDGRAGRPPKGPE